MFETILLNTLLEFKFVQLKLVRSIQYAPIARVVLERNSSPRTKLLAARMHEHFYPIAMLKS
jgi:hypothetical protein